MENSMKKILVVVVAVFVVAASNVWGQSDKPPLDVARDRQAANGAAEQTGEKAVPAAEKAANEFIQLLQQEKFEDATKRFDATMTKAMSTAELQKLWLAVVQQNGAFKKTEKGRVLHVTNYDVVDTPCEFEKSGLVVRVAFDKQLQVAGLFFLPANKPKRASDESDVQLKTTSGDLFGTIDLPSDKGPWPVVLVIAGSGPTDRDGNQPQMKNDSLRLVGKALASHGVAALRYDKRGIGKSAAAGAVEDDLRFENYVDDAAAWVKQLRGDKRFSKVIILGHSEGSLVGVLAAKREKIDGLVSVAGSGRDLASLLRDQLKRNLPPMLFEQSSHMIDELVAGRKVADVPAELTVLFRPSVQPFLMSLLKYNPTKEIGELQIPMLVVQGTTDLQVSMDDAKSLSAANKNVRLATIENMNHVLKNAPGKSIAEQVKSYSDPSLPLSPKLMDEIVAFIQKN
jgi:pimeloyl-ACP methyl ester carboxylesterase